MQLEQFSKNLIELRSKIKNKRIGVLINYTPLLINKTKIFIDKDEYFIGKNKISINDIYDAALDRCTVYPELENNQIEKIEYLEEVVCINILSWDYKIMHDILFNKNDLGAFYNPATNSNQQVSSIPQELIKKAGEVNINSMRMITSIYRPRSNSSEELKRMSYLTDYVRIYTKIEKLDLLFYSDEFNSIFMKTALGRDYVAINNNSIQGKRLDREGSFSVYTTVSAVKDTFGVVPDTNFEIFITSMLAGLLEYIDLNASIGNGRNYLKTVVELCFSDDREMVLAKLRNLRLEDIIERS